MVAGGGQCNGANVGKKSPIVYQIFSGCSQELTSARDQFLIAGPREVSCSLHSLSVCVFVCVHVHMLKVTITSGIYSEISVP